MAPIQKKGLITTPARLSCFRPANCGKREEFPAFKSPSFCNCLCRCSETKRPRINLQLTATLSFFRIICFAARGRLLLASHSQVSFKFSWDRASTPSIHACECHCICLPGPCTFRVSSCAINKIMIISTTNDETAEEPGPLRMTLGRRRRPAAAGAGPAPSRPGLGGSTKRVVSQIVTALYAVGGPLPVGGTREMRRGRATRVRVRRLGVAIDAGGHAGP